MLVKQQLHTNVINNNVTNLCKLTNKEIETLFHLLHGKTIKQIAMLLDRSPRTIETHLFRIKQKWGCSYKTDILEKAINLGIVNVIPKNLLIKFVNDICK